MLLPSGQSVQYSYYETKSSPFFTSIAYIKDHLKFLKVSSIEH